MTFIVTLIALLVERFFDWSHIRRWGWYSSYQQAILKRFSGLNSYAALAAVIVPLLIGTLIVEYLLNNLLYGFASLVFQLALLIYCLGPQNLWADAFSSITGINQGDPTAAEKLHASFGITNLSDAKSLHRALLDQIFVSANRRVFAVVFWYVILGPVGAILYRTVAQSAGPAALPELAQSAHTAEEALDWLPARLFTFLFALSGNFVQVITCWPKKILLGLTGNEMLLTECGVAALGQDDPTMVATDGATERNALSLLDRTFVIVLVIVAVVSLLG